MKNFTEIITNNQIDLILNRINKLSG